MIPLTSLGLEFRLLVRSAEDVSSMPGLQQTAVEENLYRISDHRLHQDVVSRQSAIFP